MEVDTGLKIEIQLGLDQIPRQSCWRCWGVTLRYWVFVHPLPSFRPRKAIPVHPEIAPVQSREVRHSDGEGGGPDSASDVVGESVEGRALGPVHTLRWPRRAAKWS